MRKQIEWLLFKSGVSRYRISQQTGIAQSTLSDYAIGKTDIGRMPLDTAEKLYEYYEMEWAKMKNFIRLDEKGTWRGTEHRSSVQGLAGEYDNELGRSTWENGISCYELDADGIADLYRYWIEIASLDEKDAEEMQVTIFRGKFVGYGSDSEHIAECVETMKELEAIDLYKKWMELDERYYADDDTDAYNVREYISLNAGEIMELLGV